MSLQGQRRGSGSCDWLQPCLSAAILNCLWVAWDHRSRVTFITSLEFLCTEPWDSRGVTIKGSFHFVCDSKRDHSRRTGMSLSARRVTLPTITPIVLQKRVGNLFCFFQPCNFFLPSFFCYCVCTNSFEAYITVRKEWNTLRLKVLKKTYYCTQSQGKTLPEHLCDKNTSM